MEPGIKSKDMSLVSQLYIAQWHQPGREPGNQALDSQSKRSPHPPHPHTIAVRPPDPKDQNTAEHSPPYHPGGNSHDNSVDPTTPGASRIGKRKQKLVLEHHLLVNKIKTSNYQLDELKLKQYLNKIFTVLNVPAEEQSIEYHEQSR